MKFTTAQVGDRLSVRLAFSIYSVVYLKAHVTKITENEIEASWDDIEDMELRIFKFNRDDGIASSLPKKYNKAVAWIAYFDGERSNEFR
jgi:hypothetical protein